MPGSFGVVRSVLVLGGALLLLALAIQAVSGLSSHIGDVISVGAALAVVAGFAWLAWWLISHSPDAGT
jgi:hypothetical protein